STSCQCGPRAGAPRSPPQAPWASRGGKRHTVPRTACSSCAPLRLDRASVEKAEVLVRGRRVPALGARLRALSAFFEALRASDAPPPPRLSRLDLCRRAVQRDPRL